MKIALALFSYGGIEGELLDCLMAEMFRAQHEKVELLYSRIHGDALISRSRSKAMSAFLDSKADIFFQLDHDLQWDVGDILATCAQAHEKKCVVGGMYSNRAEGKGFSGRLIKAENIKLGADAFVDAQYIGAGFTAYPRLVIEEVLKNGLDSRDPNITLTKCSYLDSTSTFYDFFRPVVVRNKEMNIEEFLSEDWSFNWRVRQANPARPQLYWAKPMLLHWGRAPFSMVQSQKPIAPTGFRVSLH